ncbi:MAG: hypothetical protein Q7R41_12970, partial [Phycisphaerales bacterium]|nr:hypothetical protein [Phycisphaerales bacterium]
MITAIFLLGLAAVPAGAQCVAATAAWQNRPFIAQSGPFTARFTASAAAAKIDGVTGLSQAVATGFPSLAAAVRFNNTGYFDVRNGGVYAADAAVPYTAGAVYSFRVSVDPALKRYSVWVAPPGAAEKALATNYAFRTEQSGAANFANWALISTAGSHQVCHFMIGAVDRFGISQLY